MVFGSTLTAPSFVEILKMKRFFSKSLLFLYKCIDITIFVFFKRKSKKASPYRIGRNRLKIYRVQLN